MTDYERSSIATSRNEGPYANAAVLLCAKALQLKDSGWPELEYSIERWFEDRPLAFQPVYEAEPDPSSGNPWPVTSMLGEPQGMSVFNAEWTIPDVTVMGMQYYHISKILVLCHKPTMNLTGFEGMKAQARTDVSVTQRIHCLY